MLYLYRINSTIKFAFFEHFKLNPLKPPCPVFLFSKFFLVFEWVSLCSMAGNIVLVYYPRQTILEMLYSSTGLFLNRFGIRTYSCKHCYLCLYNDFDSTIFGGYLESKKGGLCHQSHYKNPLHCNGFSFFTIHY